MALLGACTSDDSEEAVASATVSDEASTIEFAQRTAAVSEWAQNNNLITAADVEAAFGPSTTVAYGYTWDSDEWPSCDARVGYTFERAGESHDVIEFGVVECAVTGNEAVKVQYEALEMNASADARLSDSVGYEPAPAGVDLVDAFAYEEDGGVGAIDRSLVVSTGDVLVAIEANPHSPDPSTGNMTEGENLSRGQLNSLVQTAVEKLTD